MGAIKDLAGRVFMLRISSLVFAGFMAAVAAPSSAQESPAQDAPTTATLQRIRLNPVIKREPETVVLRPVLRPSNAVTTATLPLVELPGATSAHSALPEPKPNAIAAQPRPELPPDQEFQRVKDLLRDGRAEDARVIAQALAKNHPRSPEAPEALLLAAGTIEDLDAARKELRHIVLNYPLSPAGRQALSRIGEYSFVLGDYEESVKAFQAYRKLENDPVLLRQSDIQLTLALMRSEQFEEARVEFAALRAKYPDLDQSPEVIEGEAETLMALRETKEADKLLERIEKEFPNYNYLPKVLLSRALCAEFEGRAADAEKIYRTIAETHAGGIEAALAAKRLEDVARPLIPSTSFLPSS
jgi:TolA-binding protein